MNERVSVDGASPVLRTAPLQAGFDRACLSRFSDMTWDLSPAVFRNNARRCHTTVCFANVGTQKVVQTLREFLYARLNFDIPGVRFRIPPTSVRQHFNRAKRFLDFMLSGQGTSDLSSVDQNLLDDYRRHLQSSKQRQAAQIAQLLDTVIDLHHYREYMPSGGIPFLPWRGRTAFYVAGCKQPGENKTPRIPEQIITPLIYWSLKYVTVFARDIVAAQAELANLQLCCGKMIETDSDKSASARRKGYIERVAAFLDQRRAAKRGVPAWCSTPAVRRRTGTTISSADPINYHLIRLHAGAPSTSRISQDQTIASLIAEAAEELGTEIGGFDTTISVDPDSGLAWRRRFDAMAVVCETRMLQTACYTLCAYLTGMRDSEVQAMDADCLSVTRSEDGLIERYRIRSIAYKGRRSTGEPEEWTTIEPVAQAIAILEKLTASVRQQSGGESLWRVLCRKESGKDHLSSEVVRNLNQFRDHLNEKFGSPASPIVPNGPGDTPWRLTTRQFRRTVAWHIANRPFGVVAGKIQYKHASIAAFEGYAGESASGFSREVERERALGQLDDILTYFDRCEQGERFAGPAGPRIQNQLASVANDLKPFPGIVADTARLRKLLGHAARTLFVGVLNDCFFDPATALCLSNAQREGASAPTFSFCMPDRCPNSCVTARHRPVWEDSIKQTEELLRSRTLSAIQRGSLRQELARQQKVLAAASSPIEAND